jgi:hypothetical protein
MGLMEWTKKWRSESEMRGDELERQSDRRKSSADLLALPDLLLLLQQLLHGWLYPTISSSCPLAAQCK